MASRIIAQLLLSGGAMVLRAAAQAYQQALINGQKAGGAEALKKAAGRAQLTLEEARQILGVETGATWDAIEKVFRAKERIDQEFPDESGDWKNVHGDPTEMAQKAAKEAADEKADKASGGRGAADGASRPGGVDSGQSSKSES